MLRRLDEPGFGALDGPLGDQCPVELAATARKQVLERAAHRHFVVDVELSELPQRLVIALDELVRRLQIELLHGNGPVYNRSANLRFSS